MDTLTAEQRAVYDHVVGGGNLFLTGGGGVGKSYLISLIHQEVSKRKTVQLCALTGCAALLLGHGAKTLHSWAGIGLGKEDVQALFVKIRRNGRAMRNWLSVGLLVIDEVSMMTAELLDKLDALAQRIRKNGRPFGGIQVLLVGDFYQLPPVRRGGGGEPWYAFEAACWSSVVPHAMELTVIHRQKEAAFQQILIEARRGELSAASCAALRERMAVDWQSGKIRPTLLFPRRAEVDLINERNFQALTGRKETYAAGLVLNGGKAPAGFDVRGEAFQRYLQSVDTDAPYVLEVSLVVDAQVMLIANVDPTAGLVNGSRGVVVGYCASTGNPVVEFLNGRREVVGRHAWPLEEYPWVSRTQIPLRLAYAFTIHKSQGASLDSALVDIGSGNFEVGQAYVALSRVRSLEALYVYDFEPRVFQAHRSVVAFYAALRALPAVADEQKEEHAAPAPAPVADTAPADAAPAEPGMPPSALELWALTLSPCKGASVLSEPSEFRLSFEAVAPNDVRVVIVAHGLSVTGNSKAAQNVLKELESDVGVSLGSLRELARHGVLFLNFPAVPAEREWDRLTDAVIRVVSETPVFFALWGKAAQAKRAMINSSEAHGFHEAPHPSPLSAHKGFFGSKPFTAMREWFAARGVTWSL
jgi:ATP-dependent DNA helicase PIF1